MLLWNAAVTDARVFSARVATDAFVRPAAQSPAAPASILSRIPVQIALLILLFAAPTARAADCIPIHKPANTSAKPSASQEKSSE
jgi:hypothetical protein